jgi:hypothetical protein
MKLVKFHNEVVTANDDGSIPLNAKCIDIPVPIQEKVYKLVPDAPLFNSAEEAVEWLNQRV